MLERIGREADEAGGDDVDNVIAEVDAELRARAPAQEAARRGPG
jgi:hypothetical protein